MTSLGASLPPPGSSVWRTDRAAPGEDDQIVSESRVRHITIREATIRTIPTKHVVYQIEVNTQSDRWQVERRYSEFVELHQVLQVHMKKGMLPSKRLTGNLTTSVIEERRQGLERYLQKLVNGEKEVVFHPALLKFLEVNEHNVIWVAQHLATHLSMYGERILSAGVAFHITATQANCIARRLKLPINSRTVEQTLGTGGGQNDGPVDLSYLYDFVAQQEHLCIHPRRSLHARPEHSPVLSVSADLSPWKTLKKLEIDHFAAGYFNGLVLIHENLTHLRMAYVDVTEMRQVILDAVARKRDSFQSAKQKVDGWRQAAMKNFAENRTYYKPWQRLVALDLSCNRITELDPLCLENLPALERLILKYNTISNLNSWFKNGFILPRLREIDLTNNKITSLETVFSEEDRQKTRTPSLSLRKSTVVAPPSPVPKLKVKMDPQWVAPNGIAKSTTFGQPVKPTPENTKPPSYTAHHLISTDAPDASLDELQRRRAKRLSVVVTDDATEELPSSGPSDSVVEGRKSLVSPDTLERVEATANAQAIGGELDVRKRMEGQNSPRGKGSTGASLSSNTHRCFYRLAPALSTLILRDNLLQNLRGLEHLNALELLDVSHNMIESAQGLSSLVHMTKLKSLVLEGNPLALTKAYRQEIATKFLGPRGTLIDGKSSTQPQ